MRTFLLTSEQFVGAVKIAYDDWGYLSILDFTQAELTAPQHRAIISRIPTADVSALPLLTNGTKSKLTEVKEEITFTTFWKKWLKQFGSENAGGKVPAERAWNKLTEANRAEAYNKIQKYSQTIKPGCCNCDGSTYLNQQRWL
jgi:hypothetical protein